MNDAITAEIDDNSVDSETVDSPIESTEIPKLDPVVPKQPKQRKPTAYLYSYLVPHLIFHPFPHPMSYYHLHPYQHFPICYPYCQM